MASQAASLFLGGYVATDDGAGHVKMSTRASETMMGLRSGDAGHTLVLLPHSRRLLACSSPSLTTRAMATNDDNLQRQQQKDSTSLSASTSRSGWPQPPMAGISSLIGNSKTNFHALAFLFFPDLKKSCSVSSLYFLCVCLSVCLSVSRLSCF